MQLTPVQLAQFDRDGYLFFPSLFTPEEIQVLFGEVPQLYAQYRPENVREKGSEAVRANFAAHMYSYAFARLARHPRMVKPIMCFTEYGVRTDPSGRYACLYKRWHLIGLEVGISVAAVGLRHEPTGCPTGFRADAVATAKRHLKPGEILDGEGGYTVVGRLMPATDSLQLGALPLGLAHGWRLTRPVAAGELVHWADVAVDETNSAVRVRREMEQRCATAPELVLV